MSDRLHDGSDAVDAAAARRPDLMLLDIGLPGMDGYEVARRLRSDPGLKDVRLIACTGYGREEDVRKMGEAGFDRHLLKPVSAAQLEQVLGHGSAPRRGSAISASCFRVGKSYDVLRR